MIQSRETFAILFFMRYDKEDKSGNAPVYMRITINGEKAEYALKRKLSPKEWNGGSFKGNSGAVKELKSFMDTLRVRVREIQDDFIRKNETASAKQVVDVLNGKNTRIYKSVVDVFNLHNAMVYNLIGIDYATATYTRYVTTLKHIKDYMLIKYGRKDMSLQEMDYDFIRGFEMYMKTTRKCNHNTTMKYVKMYKAIIHYALKNDWLEKDPFSKFECKIEKVDRTFLSDNELKLLQEKIFDNERLDAIRDVFLFACYSGLSYSDISKLTKDHISEGVDGRRWIFIKRTKTNVLSKIPLHSIAESILEKYKDHPVCNTKGLLLPIPSNQKVNEYLKEVAAICHINKNLTFHIARHSFSTTVTLEKGVSIEAVSNMLGHTQIRTTQIYSKVTENKIAEETKFFNE